MPQAAVATPEPGPTGTATHSPTPPSAGPPHQPVAAQPAETQATARKLRVFVSYSRDDLDFADQLVAALSLYGFDPTIDRHGISGGENWQARLGALILESDTVVFVLSPSSARSDICEWEVAEALRLGKRIFPVMPRPLGETPAPSKLADLNYVFFYPEPRAPGSGFGTGLQRLVASLSTDVTWLRSHTRLMERAVEWDVGGRQVSRLLSGSDISAAKTLIASRPKDAPEPTTLQLDYVRASEAEEASRANVERKRLDEMALAQAERANALATAEQALKDKAAEQKAKLWLRNAIVAVATVAALGLGSLSYGLYGAFKTADVERRRALDANLQAFEARTQAEERRIAAEAAQKQAETERATARASLYDADVNRARALIERAEGLVETGSTSHAIQLAIEAVTVDRTQYDGKAFYIPGANRILALSNLVWRNGAHDPKTRVTALAVSPDEKFVVSGGTDKTIKLTSVASGKVVGGNVKLEASVASLSFMPDGNRVVAAADNFVHVIDVAARPITRALRIPGHNKPVTAVAVSPDGKRIASGSEDATVRIWDAETGQPLATIEFDVKVFVRTLAYVPDGRKLVVSLANRGLRVVDVESGAVTSTIPGADFNDNVAVTPDGKHIVAAAYGGRIEIMDAGSGAITSTITAPSDIVRLSIDPGGAIVAATGYANGHKNVIRVLRWPNASSAAAAQEPEEIGSHFGTVGAIASLRDGRVVTGSTIGTTPSVWLWPRTPRPAPGDLLEQAKLGLKSCLSVSDRGSYFLPPVQKSPDDWCLTLRKKPYEDATIIGSLDQVRDYSDRALYNGDFTHALEAANIALAAEPQVDWVEVNKAHALMFLNRSDEARAIYLRRRGETLNLGVRTLTWEQAVLEDFEALAGAGLWDGLMAQVRILFGQPPSPAEASAATTAPTASEPIAAQPTAASAKPQ